MERFTERLEDGGTRLNIIDYGEPPYPVVTNDFVERLAEYEDTGLEPEDIEIGWWSPVCVNCDGKTEDGYRTEKCMYVYSDDYNSRYDKCAEQSKLIYKLAKAYKDGKLAILE